MNMQVLRLQQLQNLSVEGVDDLCIQEYDFRESCSSGKEINYGTVDLIPNEGTLAWTMPQTRTVSLNVRSLPRVEWSDVVAGDNYSWKNYLCRCMYNEETKT